MKILIFGTVRTRSSYLLDVLSQYHNLTNLFEPYAIEVKVSNKLLFRRPDQAWIKYKEELNSITKNISSDDNFGLKIFPSNTFNFWKYNFVYNKTLDWNITKNDLLDVESTYNLSMYDQIFVLHRENFADLVCSYFHAWSTQFLYKKNEKILVQTNKPKQKRLQFNYNKLKTIIIEDLIFQHHVINLQKTNLSLIKLEYNNVPTYVKENYKNITSNLLESNYDYKNTISNYDEILENIQKIKTESEIEELKSMLEL